MKKIKFNLMVIALVLGVGAAVASKAASHKTKMSTDLYWFDANNNFVDQGAEEDQDCPEGTAVICERGYTNITGDNKPAGTLMTTLKKAE
ncbi:DUF6520 family protein [Mucilaginibacter sp.]